MTSGEGVSPSDQLSDDGLVPTSSVRPRLPSLPGAAQVVGWDGLFLLLLFKSLMPLLADELLRRAA
jgi:hypothetical protein